MTKLAKWHVEEILENFVLGGFPVKDDDRFLACSSILTSMIDTARMLIPMEECKRFCQEEAGRRFKKKYWNPITIKIAIA